MKSLSEWPLFRVMAWPLFRVAFVIICLCIIAFVSCWDSGLCFVLGCHGNKRALIESTLDQEDRPSKLLRVIDPQGNGVSRARNKPLELF